MQLDDTLSVILAGGVGSRLAPLTNDRAKPAVPFGGKYRIIDFTLANCLHSGLRRVLVFTQYKSHSLQKHLRDGWSIFNPQLGEYITPVPPQMRKSDDWYQGTADAIYQNMYLLVRSEAKYVVILSGDHIYRMDYAGMIKAHKESGSDVTIACMQVPVSEASAFGVMSVNENQKIIDFEEKPSTPMSIPGDEAHSMVSMGVYVFTMDVLLEALEKDHQDNSSANDFGNNIIPGLVKSSNVQAYTFGGSEGRVSADNYWRDVGTIDSFYDANMDLLEPVPPINLYQQDWPIRTYQGQFPPARTVPGESGTEGIAINSIMSGGVVIAGGSVQHSILSHNVYVGDEAMIEDCLLFEGVRVGDSAKLKNCIVDKHVHIPAGEVIGYDARKDAERFTMSEAGVVVLEKGQKF